MTTPARDWFDRQYALLRNVVSDAQSILDNTQVGNAKELLEALDWCNSNAHKLCAAELCERVLMLMRDSNTLTFDDAFDTVWNNATERLLGNNYREASTGAADRFLASQRREADAYFIDRFQAVKLERGEEVRTSR